VSNIESNLRANFYVNDTLQNILTPIVWAAINNSYLVKYAAIAGQDFDTWWYISFIGYEAWDWFTYIPSISRWVASGDNWELIKASSDFPNVTASGGTNFLTEDIAITGLVNKVDGLVNTDITPWRASLDLDRPYTRAELLAKVKKKIFTVNGIENWCTGNIADLDLSNWDHSSCDFNIQGENIAFYKWDVTIKCSSDPCNIQWKNALIVKDGRVTIKSNINTKESWWKLLIVSVTDQWLSNISISNWSDHQLSEGKQKWWIGIDEDVTNIDSFLLSQWPLVSIDNDGDVITNYQDPDNLLNQLHIYGSVFSLNTIGWERTWECPYIEQNCSNADTAKVYDLSFLRRYTLVDAVNYNGSQWLVPYDPNLNFEFPDTTTTSKSSGGYVYFGDGTPDWTTQLRESKPEHKNAPVIVERDNRWSANPSYFAKD
jgi:hypothetical protein